MYNFTLTWHKSYIIRAGKKCNNIFTIACNSSSVNVSISFHADRISSIIVLYGSPFQIHKLRIKNHELKFSTESICYIDVGDGCSRRNVLMTILRSTNCRQPYVINITVTESISFWVWSLFVNFPIDGSGGEFLFGFPLLI